MTILAEFIVWPYCISLGYMFSVWVGEWMFLEETGNLPPRVAVPSYVPTSNV